MILIGILLLVLFWALSFFQNRRFDARLKFARDITNNFDLGDVFEGAYLGNFAFDEALPHEALRDEIEGRFDSGVGARLALHLAETLPMGVLKTAADDILIGKFRVGADYMAPIETQINMFARQRGSQLSDLLKEEAKPKSTSDRRRRRRR